MPAHFTPALFEFLKDLRAHNDREWFAAHKARYERDVRDPMLRFVADLATPLAKISREVLADPRPVGGSLFRIYRDTRFSKDKSPYKTHAAAQFRHRAGRDVHAPGFYVHLEPGRVFFAAGIWQPDPPSLQAIRRAIAERPAAWRRIVSNPGFRKSCRLSGDAAIRPPQGFDPGHPLIEDIKRKDFVAVAEASQAQAVSSGFQKRFTDFCGAAAPLNAFLAKAVGLDW